MLISIPAQIHVLQQNLVPLFNGNARTTLSSSPGVYCFWYKNEQHPLPIDTQAVYQGASITLQENQYDPKLHIQRANNRYYQRLVGSLRGETPVPYLLDDYTCLYVGKTNATGGINKRIGQHVCRDTVSRTAYLTYRLRKKAPVTLQTYPATGPARILKRNTSSQFRAGLEYIFRHELPTYAYERMKDSVFISLVDENSLNFRDRFYLEDLGIGLFHPWFNLDSER